MRTVLIVEDEKMIRKGLSAMVRRSSVPVESIVECANGEEAWAYLEDHEADCVLTDIRMPKMTGIELIRRMQSLPKMPKTIAVSGYDDFTYAVEMLRAGAKDYLLKPVDREKLRQILQKIEGEVSEGQAMEERKRKHLLKELWLLCAGKLPETALFDTPQEDLDTFFPEAYVLCATAASLPAQESAVLQDGRIVLPGIGGMDVTVVPVEETEGFLLKQHGGSVGMSGPKRDPQALAEAFRESQTARREAFLSGSGVEHAGQVRRLVPVGLREMALKEVTPEVIQKRVQLLGTDREEELASSFERLFVCAKDRLLPEEFSAAMGLFFDGVRELYPCPEEEDKNMEKLSTVWGYAALGDYRAAFTAWCSRFRADLRERLATGPEARMQQALDYMQEHFAENLDMAVVSNVVSMNYTAFSTAFKAYTGENFVASLRRIRLEKAKDLLTNTDKKIAEVAAETGFESDRNFMKVFKASVGVSPTEYRRNTGRSGLES